MRTKSFFSIHFGTFMAGSTFRSVSLRRLLVVMTFNKQGPLHCKHQKYFVEVSADEFSES